MSTPEKLVYLQNGVFKRKEMTNGLQFYSNGSFGTFALPSANGNYVLTNNNNVFTWTDAGDVSTGDETPAFTSLDNSYFKGSDGQPITIYERGTIPFFRNNSIFGGINLPSSGTYVLTVAGDESSPTFHALDASVIYGGMGYGNTSNRYVIANWNSTTSTHKDLALPDKSGSFFLQADSSNNCSFATVNPKSLFHDALGMESDTQKIVTYWGDNAYGLSVPTSAGYATFKIAEGGATSPVLTNLTPQILYQDILGCTSTEQCLVYNNDTKVSKLTLPSSSGKYMLEVSSGALSLVPPDTKLHKTFEYTWMSSHQVVSETLTSANTNLSEAVTLVSGKSYLVTIDAVMTCPNYEQALVGFSNTPSLIISVKPSYIINVPLDNPVPTIGVSGSSVVTAEQTGSIALTVTRIGDTSITHYLKTLKVTVIEL